jgi:hypothetical protein
MEERFAILRSRRRTPFTVRCRRAKACALLSTLQRADIVLPTTDGREIRLRRIAEPKLLPQQLGVNLPVRVPTQFPFQLWISGLLIA